MHKEAQQDSKLVKKKLQRQQELESGSRGGKQKQKARSKEEGPGESEQALLRRDSSQGGEQ